MPRTLYADRSRIERLYQLDSKKKISSCRKLTKRHIGVWGLKKMDVKLAAEVLSQSVAAALDLYAEAKLIEDKSNQTSLFVFKMDRLFDSVNSRTLKHQKKETCAVTETSLHVDLWEKNISGIEKWSIRSSKTGKKIYAASKNEWLITLNAFKGIIEILLKKIKFVLIARFSQDALENTLIRRHGGLRDNPYVHEFRFTIQKVIISNFLK